MGNAVVAHGGTGSRGGAGHGTGAGGAAGGGISRDPDARCCCCAFGSVEAEFTNTFCSLTMGSAPGLPSAPLSKKAAQSFKLVCIAMV